MTLLADRTEDVTITTSITLDLNSKTLTNTNAGKATISVTGGTVTVKNGTVIGGASYYNIEVTRTAMADLTLRMYRYRWQHRLVHDRQLGHADDQQR